MRIEKCYFCGGPVYPGHGTAFVRNDAKMFRFCRSKCHRNFKAKKNPRKIRWTKAYRKTHGKDMILDPVLDFEKKRNEAVRYNRDLMVDTIQAMNKIDEIRTNREERFYDKRMEPTKELKRDQIKSDLIKHSTLIADPEMRKRVEKIKEKRDLKKAQLKEEKRMLNKSNLGMNEEVEDINIENIGVEKVVTRGQKNKQKLKKIAYLNRKKQRKMNIVPEKKKKQQQNKMIED